MTLGGIRFLQIFVHIRELEHPQGHFILLNQILELFPLFDHQELQVDLMKHFLLVRVHFQGLFEPRFDLDIIVIAINEFLDLVLNLLLALLGHELLFPVEDVDLEGIFPDYLVEFNDALMNF